jgi:hypothetical protein
MDSSKRVMEINADLRALVEEGRACSTANAFPVWFLENYESLSEEDVDSVLQDQAESKSTIAVRYDPDKLETTGYLFTFSTVENEVISKINSLETEIHVARNANPKCRNVAINVVSLVESSSAINDAILDANERLSKRAKLVNMSNCVVKHTGLNYFDAAVHIAGVDVEVKFQGKPLIINGGMIGVVDASSFTKYVGEEDLLAFNIRKFLGTTNKTNRKMMEALRSGNHQEFWKLNNGLVCTYSNMADRSGDTVDFRKLSIVNGAQTINTIANFIKTDRVREPVWVVAKFIHAVDRDLATRLTVASNTQSAVSTQDIRSSDNCHEWMASQLEQFGRKYIYKRGPRSTLNSVQMKDLVQAWASWKGQPHIAFSRSGSLFDGSGRDNDVTLYESVFDLPISEVDSSKRRDMIAERLLAHNVLLEVRSQFTHFLKERSKENALGELDDVDYALFKTFKSTTHHIVWIYGDMLRQVTEREMHSTELINLVQKLVSQTFREVLDNVMEYVRLNRGLVIPRDLKSDHITRLWDDAKWATSTKSQKAVIEALHDLLER